MKRNIGEFVAKYLQKKGELHNLLDFNRIRLLCSGSSVILALISQQQSGGKKMKKIGVSFERKKENTSTVGISACRFHAFVQLRKGTSSLRPQSGEISCRGATVFRAVCKAD